MIKPDLIIVWPFAFDYPYFRERIVANRNRFAKVIISFTANSTQRDFRPFFMENHPDFTFVNSHGQNWYHDAITAALKQSTAEWVLFMEQDFVFDDALLDHTLRQTDFDFVCLNDKGRLHLAYFLVKRAIINKTSQEFAAMPNSSVDNFDIFTQEVNALGKGYKFMPVPGQFYHLSGTTHNYHLITNGQLDLVTSKELFKDYNQKCLDAKIRVTPEWRSIMELVKNSL